MHTMASFHEAVSCVANWVGVCVSGLSEERRREEEKAFSGRLNPANQVHCRATVAGAIIVGKRQGQQRVCLA